MQIVMKWLMHVQRSSLEFDMLNGLIHDVSTIRAKCIESYTHIEAVNRMSKQESLFFFCCRSPLKTVHGPRKNGLKNINSKNNNFVNGLNKIEVYDSIKNRGQYSLDNSSVQPDSFVVV